jgi:hypothetical protein
MCSLLNKCSKEEYSHEVDRNAEDFNDDLDNENDDNGNLVDGNLVDSDDSEVVISLFTLT